MNRITLASLCAVVLFAFSCRPPCHIDLEKPTDIKPIDWDAYNDAYTVFWNILSDNCNRIWYPTEDTIMVYGKIDAGKLNGFVFFELICEEEYEHNNIFDLLHDYNRYPGPCVFVSCSSVADGLREKFASCDLTGRCYVKGVFTKGSIGGNGGIEGPDNCCFVTPGIYLYSVDDIYFENKNTNEN